MVPVTIFLAAAVSAETQRAPGVTELLALYLSGDHAAAVAPLARVTNAGSFAADLEVDGADWIAKGTTPGDIQLRRLAAAGLALEFTALRMEDEWYAIRPLIEWACSELRKAAPGDAERAWQRAALAVIQGARDNAFARRSAITVVNPNAPFAVDHLGHAVLRFPADPAVLFAQGFFEEFSVPVEGSLRSIDIDTANQASARAIEFYRRAAADPALAHESALAIGYIQLRMKRLDAVLPELTKAAESTDPFVKYLAHLLQGRTFEQLGGKENAIAAYRAALTVIPNAQSASIALAALLHVSDDPDPAIAIMNQSFAARPREDPWREYGFGQFRHWPRYRDDMRRAIR